MVMKKRSGMKKAAIATMLVIYAPAAFADGASKEERALLCKTIDKGLADEAADMALDRKACLASGAVESNALPGGKREIKGRLAFRAPARPTFTLTCTATYAPPLASKTVATLGTCE